MSKQTGLGKRLIAAMQAVGYGSDNEYGVDIMRFALDHRIPPGFCYKWLKEEAVPSRQNVIRLAEILGTTPGLLLFGPELERTGKQKRRSMHPIAGGSDAEWRHYVNRLRAWWWSLRTSHRWALA